MEEEKKSEPEKDGLKEALVKIKATLEKIRPFLQREGGDVRFSSFDSETGVVKVEMLGACNGCILAGDEIVDGVETILRDEVPSVTKVELVAPSSDPSVQSDGSYGYFPGGIPVFPGFMYEDDEEDDDPLSLKKQLEEEKNSKDDQNKK